MPPSWAPLRFAMQRYCEPYFTAVVQWKNYSKEGLLENRILAIETAVHLFKKYHDENVDYIFELHTEFPSVKLLPEVEPSAGKLLVNNGDSTAYGNAKILAGEAVFAKGGIFFQSTLLKALAGWNEEMMKVANVNTRKSITACVEKLFRLPETAGKCSFLMKSANASNSQPFTAVDSVTLSDNGAAFVQFIHKLNEEERASRNEARKRKSSSLSKAISKKPKVSGDNEQRDGIPWCSDQLIVGTRVCAYFPRTEEEANGMERKIFEGSVVSYAKASSKVANDQLYHIKWEDGDEEDFDDDDLRRGMELYEKQHGWIRDHELVGQKVAVYFGDDLFEGTVALYNPPTDEDPALFHIRFADGDEQDSEEHEVREAIALYEKKILKKQAPKKAREKEKLPKKELPKREPLEIKEPQRADREEELTEDQDVVEVEARESRPRRSIEPASPARKVEELEVKVEKREPRPKRAIEAAASPPVKEAKAPSGSATKKEKVKEKKVKQQKPKDEQEEEADPVEWETEGHDIIGTKVAALFPDNSTAGKRGAKRKKLFFGVIEKFAPETAPGENDQLYHVKFEDDDEQDYDEKEIQELIRLYRERIPQHQLLVEPNTASENGHSTSAEEQTVAMDVEAPKPADAQEVDLTSPTAEAVLDDLVQFAVDDAAAAMT